MNIYACTVTDITRKLINETKDKLTEKYNFLGILKRLILGHKAKN